MLTRNDCLPGFAQVHRIYGWHARLEGGFLVAAVFSPAPAFSDTGVVCGSRLDRTGFRAMNVVIAFRAAFSDGSQRVRLAGLNLCLVLATLLGSVGFAQDPDAAEPKALPIGVNGVGYLPQSKKLATVVGGGEEFTVRDAQTGEEVLRGKLNSSGDSTGDGPKLKTADFSALDREGEYVVSVPGVGESGRFRVAQNLYNWPFYLTTRAMYLMRCGCAVEGEFGGDTFKHAACHTDDAYLGHAGGPAGERSDGTGGWHDAGDYNKYTINGAFTAGMILQAWEHFSDRLTALTLDIPESKNDVPDLLDEVRWELDWLLKMQDEDGRAYHKVSTLQFGGMIPPETETARRYFSPWGTAATADLAAIMAQAARVYRPIDPEFADRCLSAAKKAYAFLESHPDDHRPDLSAFATGPYGTRDSDDRLWAAAELWETTGEPKYLADVERRISSPRRERGQAPTVVDSDWDWGNVRNLGVFTYVLSKRPGRDPALVSARSR